MDLLKIFDSKALLFMAYSLISLLVLSLVINFIRLTINNKKNIKREKELKHWEDELIQKGIKYSIQDSSLVACINKRDEEGHHYIQLVIEENNLGKFTGSFRGIGATFLNLSPTDAISKFKTHEIIFFT